MGNYQDRKDIDILYDELYDPNTGLFNVLRFKKDSPYRSIATELDGSDAGTIDALLEYYDVSGDKDFSIYVTKTELNGILSSYVTTQTLEDYALKSELFSGSYNDLTNVPSTFPPSSHTHTKSNITDFAHSHLPTEVSDDSSDYPNIYRWSLPSTPSTVKSTLNAIDIALGRIVELGAFEVVSSLPTASDTTMGKLYFLLSNSKIDVYYTERSGTWQNYSYSWQKVNLNIAWNDIQSKPSDYPPSTHTHDAYDIEYTYYGQYGLMIISTVGDFLDNMVIRDVAQDVADILTHIDTYYDFYQ